MWSQNVVNGIRCYQFHTHRYRVAGRNSPFSHCVARKMEYGAYTPKNRNWFGTVFGLLACPFANTATNTDRSGGRSTILIVRYYKFGKHCVQRPSRPSAIFTGPAVLQCSIMALSLNYAVRVYKLNPITVPFTITGYNLLTQILTNETEWNDGQVK